MADTSGTVGALLANLAHAVHTAADSAVAFVSVAALRHGSAPASEPPGPGEVRAAAGHWLARRRAGGTLTDPVLLRHLLWTAVATGLPLQLHAGGGEGCRAGCSGGGAAGIAGFAAATAGLGTDLVLLHGLPYHRHAARLAGAFPHVYVDLGPALAHTGAADVLAQVLELAPFGKLLYSSGAGGLPELHVVGAKVFGQSLARVLGGWVTDGSWALADARRVAELIASGNARRVYGLDES